MQRIIARAHARVASPGGGNPSCPVRLSSRVTADGVGLYCDACVEGWIVIAGICHDSVRLRADSDGPACVALTKKDPAEMAGS